MNFSIFNEDKRLSLWREAVLDKQKNFRCASTFVEMRWSRSLRQLQCHEGHRWPHERSNFVFNYQKATLMFLVQCREIVFAAVSTTVHCWTLRPDTRVSDALLAKKIFLQKFSVFSTMDTCNLMIPINLHLIVDAYSIWYCNHDCHTKSKLGSRFRFCLKLALK